MSLHTMIQLNNTTVAFLRQKDYSNAVVSSAEAMKFLQYLLRSQNIISSSGASAPDCVDQCMLLLDANSHDSDDHDNSPFVYDLGIVIPPSVAMEYEVVCAIRIFNAALSHQMYAQEQQDRATSLRYLLKAKRLYEFTTTVNGVMDQNTLFNFAVTNNTAVIELHTGNEALAKEYFEHLMSVLMLLVDRGCSSKLRHVCGFLRNVSSQALAAPAA